MGGFARSLGDSKKRREKKTKENVGKKGGQHSKDTGGGVNRGGTQGKRKSKKLSPPLWKLAAERKGGIKGKGRGTQGRNGNRQKTVCEGVVTRKKKRVKGGMYRIKW